MTTQPYTNGSGLGGSLPPIHPNLKQCSKCKQYKPANLENFYANPRNKSGLSSQCMACVKATTIAWHIAHPERLKEIRSKGRANRREKRNEEKRAYRLRHRDRENEKSRLRFRKWREKSPKPPKPVKVQAPKAPKPEKPPVILAPQIRQAIDSFLKAKGLRAKVTIDGYRRTLEVFGAYCGEVWPPTEDEINGFLAELKGRNLSDTSIWNDWRRLKGFFNWLHLRGRIEKNPIKLAERPRKPFLLPRAPKEAELARLLVWLEKKAGGGDWKDIRAWAFVLMALDTGMRVGEVANCKLDDLMLAEYQVFIPESKTCRQRYCALSEAGREALRKWLEVRARRNPESESLFVGEQGPMTTSGLFRVLQEALKEAGLKHFGVHALRHAHAIYSLRNGAKLTDIQKQLGHTNIATTARYLMVDDEGRVERHAQTSPLDYLKGKAQNEQQ